MKNTLLTFTILLFMFGCGNKKYSGPVTDHFNGTKFYCPWGGEKKGYWDVIKWRLTGNSIKWPDKVERKFFPIPDAKINGKKIKITHVGHASTLIQTEGLNILTDPVWSERSSPFKSIGPKRVTEPGIDFDKTPKIDVILVSHGHFDHLDLETIKKFYDRDKPLILTPLGNDIAINKFDKNIKVNVMDWSDNFEFGGAKFTLEPAQHWTARGLNDANDALWGAFIIETKSKKVYFAGDTGYGPHFKWAGEKYNGFDLALIPIGAYEPRWFMKFSHTNPEEAVVAMQDLKAKKAFGIHFEVFKLTDEGVDEPRKHAIEALKKHNIDKNDFVLPYVGEEFEF